MVVDLTRHPALVGYDLIGAEITVARDGIVTAGRIVECEAYAGPRDAASHSARLTVGRQTMAQDPGTIYVYLSYGIHRMMNIVAHESGEGGAVLLRALEPTVGQDIMRERRGEVPDRRLCQGPGSLGQALGIRLDDLGRRLGDVFTLTAGPRGAIMAGPRVGIRKAVAIPWRFWEADNPYVSSHRRGIPVTADDVRRSIPPADALIP